jgi:hypothetical protein
MTTPRARDGAAAMDADQPSTPHTTAPAPAPTGILRTTTGRAWKLKTLGFALAFALLAVWGWYDAYHVYPKRGRDHEQFMKRNYLEEADKAFQLATVSVEDPATEYRRLSGIPEGELSTVERARLAWLRSISRLTSLTKVAAENRTEIERRASDPTHRQPTRTMFADPRRELSELGAQLGQSDQPKPLAAYDLPVQFLFLYGGAIGCVYLVGLFFVVRSRVYRYEPAEHRLTLPTGRTLVPADIALVDKRQWHKYIVFLKPVDGSPEIRLDLYRHRPLEDWVLEMEKLTPGYVPPEPDADAKSVEAGADASPE